ncbi:E3 ubiquitin-protein ligase UBR4-like [Mercenaria mercenaria]|uniref:E3 ubiquitin-protein ligase UBR4-like n=1 Tax=Mercenaria mercenaria TaxID=6596 RepID=UPI00234F793C|nr:E3 ubiquitin-protein ligase UBR4-like [Mercenaria mercenaria]
MEWKFGINYGKPSNCFGCASAAVEHCITLLRALVTNTNLRHVLCSQGMIQELIDFNLRRGTLHVRSEVRSLLCLLTKDNRRETEEMNNIIMTHISAADEGHLFNPDLGSSVRHEILLLANSLKQEDTCWEFRVRCVMRLFLMGMSEMQLKQPVIMECVTLPCLRILEHLIRPDKSQIAKDGSQEEPPVSAVMALPPELHVNSAEWLTGNQKYSYQNWQKMSASPTSSAADDTNSREERRNY